MPTRRRLRELVEHREAARMAVAIEARTSLLFSFERLAARDAVGTAAGARLSSPWMARSRRGWRVGAATFGRW